MHADFAPSVDLLAQLNVWGVQAGEGGPVSLRLEVPEFSDEVRWRWRLTDDRGAFLADHAVALDRAAAEYQGFVDTYGFVRWHADPESGPGAEQALVERLGSWIGEHVWGTVGEAIAARAAQAPVVVRVSLPPEATALLFRPLELGCVGGVPLARQDVSLVFELAGALGGEKAPVGERLRMLALFSVPTDQTALNARYERYELRQMVHRVARTAGRAIELRVLQYGVTREMLARVLREGGGWDAIHFSGHGLPAGLVLERPDGTADTVPSDELGVLLRPVRAQLKLVTLSSCESAAATVAQTRRLLGIPSAASGEDGAQEDGSQPLPAVAQGLVERLGCAVLAMRYPVGDEFAIALAGALYRGLFEDGQPLARALQVAIEQATAPHGGRTAPALSAATPALFGATAAELSLAPPPVVPGQRATFDLTSVRLARFPSEPRRFVGRVGALARASGALAPTGEHRAVLFHGMAGAGKTACALELAYCHQGRFEAAAWHSAPREGQNTTGALAGFTLALDAQLEGLELAPAAEDRELLERVLPRFTRALGDRAALIVLDNVESLLTDEGAWLDPRWELTIDALLAHDGLSRLVLTSRHVPARLAGDGRVLVERIDTLSANESVLLARQLPHLGALIEAGDAASQVEGRELVRRVLETTQGNPKLIELADHQAIDREALRERLRETAAAWGEGADRLAAFFATAQPAPDHDAADFLRVLETWTTGAARRLSEAARTAFHMVCALEEEDRLGVVINGNWSDLWKRLKRHGEPPDPHAALDAVAAQGLIDIQTGEERAWDCYRVHPAVEHAGREAAGADFQAAVDVELAAYWDTVFHRAIDGEAHDRAGGLVMRAGLAAAPYLLRLGSSSMAQMMLERVVTRDESPRTLAAVLPLLEQIVEKSAGTPGELMSMGVLLRVRSVHQPVQTIPLLRDLLDRFVQAGDFEGASSASHDLINIYKRIGWLDEALTLLDTAADYRRRAGLGPWTQLTSQASRLQILQAMGRSDLVLTEVETLRERMDALPTASDPQELVEWWNVREGILDAARSAAIAIRRFETALELNQEIRASKRDRAASALAQARTAFNDYGPLLALKRYEDVAELLQKCRVVFEAEESREDLAHLYSAWASLEGSLRHYEQAIGFTRRALRFGYAFGSPNQIASAHSNLASFLVRVGQDQALVIAHRLGAALISHQTASGMSVRHSRALGNALRDGGEQALPASFAALCDHLQRTEEVDFARLFAALPARAPSGDDALREVIDGARSLPHVDEWNVGRLLEEWKPQLATVVAAAQGDAAARSALDEFCDALAKRAEWAALPAVLRRVVAGERDGAALLDGLDPVDTAIVSAILDQL